MLRAVMRSYVLLGLLLGAGLVLGCEEDVNPILGTERAFTVYGFFNPEADTQAMRVFPIEDLLAPTRPTPLDAQVRSMEVQTGLRHAWQDSVVRFESGRYGHVYWAAFRAEFEHTYRLEVERADGAVSHVEVTVPPLSEPELLGFTVAPRFVRVPVLWRKAPRLNNIGVHYRVRVGQGEEALIRTFDFQYGLEQEAREDGTVVEILVSDDARLIFQELFFEGLDVSEARLVEVALRVLVSSEAWLPPTGVYDAELLVEPGTFSNVENGFGFVGAGYPATFRWTPPDSVARAAGYALDEED